MHDDETVLALDGEEDWANPEKEKKPFPENLPPSSDSEFWGTDAHKTVVSKEELTQRQQALLEKMKAHSVRMEGQEIICVSCPYTHSIPNPQGIFTVSHTGNLILLDKGS